MPDVVGRAPEQAALRELLATATGPRLAWLHGRPGMGKTFLLLNAWPPTVRVFHHSARFTTPGQNLQDLANAVQQFTGAPPNNHLARSLADVLAPITSAATTANGRSPSVIILDNCDFLTDGSAHSTTQLGRDLLETLNSAPAGRPLLIVLCGGTTEMRDTLAGPGGPLFGHIDWEYSLPPLDYWSTVQLAPYTTPRDRIVLHAVFGGAPQYVAHLRPSGGLVDNIARLCIARHGAIRQSVETALLREPGIRDHATYHALLRAMGAGFTTVNAIHTAAALHGTDLTATRAKLERLISLGYVTRERNFGARNTQPFRYLLADSAFAFHYTFVSPHDGLLDRMDPRLVFDRHIAAPFDAFVASRLVALVTEAYDRLQPMKRLPAVNEWGRWEGRTPDRQPANIDLIARLDDGRMMTGGVHWHKEPVGASTFAQHVAKLQSLAAKGEAWASQALSPEAPVLWVSAAGFRSDFAREVAKTHRESTLLSLDSLFRQ